MPDAVVTPAPRPITAILQLAAFVTLLAIAWLVAHELGLFSYLDRERLAAAIAATREVPWAVPAFIVLYAIVAAFGLPGTPLTLAGGALFGAVWGTAFNWIGATAGATGAYLLARLLGRDSIRALLGRHATVLDRVALAGSFAALVRLRLIPAVPFNTLNFGAGLAGIPFSTYVASTALGIIPGTAVYTYFAGSLVAGAEGVEKAVFLRVVVAGLLLVALSFLPWLARRLGWVSAAVALLAVPALDAQTVDHGAFDALLAAHVTEGRVDYAAFDRDPRFRRYLALLEQVDPARLSDAERLAFWINVYNAYTIALINGRGERRSIRNINKVLGITVRSPWAEPIVKVGGVTRTLDDVEHRIIRQEFKDARIHFALVCAAVGCPPLRSEAYSAARLDAQLDAQARRFLGQPEKNRVDTQTRVVYGSPIFTWYREDFGGDLRGIGTFWARYVADGRERDLLLSGDFRWIDTDYDWSLNVRR